MFSFFKIYLLASMSKFCVGRYSDLHTSDLLFFQSCLGMITYPIRIEINKCFASLKIIKATLLNLVTTRLLNVVVKFLISPLLLKLF